MRLAAIAAAGVGLLILPPFVPGFWHFLLIDILILGLFALSQNLLMGTAGMISFGHAAYYALGAYTAGLLTARLGWPMAAAFAAGPIVAALGAGVFGFFCVRRHQTYFIMLTLAFAQLTYAVIFKAYAITGGDDGLPGIRPIPELLAPLNFYYFALAVTSVCAFFLYRITKSQFGYSLAAIRDNETRAQFIGLPVRRYRLWAFVIAGFFAGVAGVLSAFFIHSVSPQLAFWTTSARPFMAVIIGGIDSFGGPLLGAAVLQVLVTQVSRITDNWLLVQGLIVLLVALYMQRGLTGLFDESSGLRAWYRRWQSRSSS